MAERLIYLVRHGIAEDRSATSPLKRAAQTADLIAAAFPAARRETWPELAPGVDERALAERLDETKLQRVMLVGHEPDFGELLAWWLTGRREGFSTHFRKGGIACVAAAGSPPQGRATLEWLATARQMGRVGSSRD
jgi:phosphohistidine phosphatase